MAKNEPDVMKAVILSFKWLTFVFSTFKWSSFPLLFFSTNCHVHSQKYYLNLIMGGFESWLLIQMPTSGFNMATNEPDVMNAVIINYIQFFQQWCYFGFSGTFRKGGDFNKVGIGMVFFQHAYSVEAGNLGISVCFFCLYSCLSCQYAYDNLSLCSSSSL